MLKGWWATEVAPRVDAVSSVTAAHVLRWLLATVLAIPLVLAGGIFVSADALVTNPLTLRYSDVVNGDWRMIGNGVLACDRPVGTTFTCAQLNSGATTSNLVNDFFYMRQSDVDSNPATFNSSTARVTIPSGAAVASAYLFWGGNTGSIKRAGGAAFTTGCAPADTTTNTLVRPAGTPQTTTPILSVNGGAAAPVSVANYSSETYAQLGANQSQFYNAFNDVSGLLSGRTGTLDVTVGNVWAPAGQGCFGGWSLAVVYDYGAFIPGVADSSAREVIIYGGNVRQSSTDQPQVLTFDGFVAAEAGSRIGLTAYEGDGAITGDFANWRTTTTTNPTPTAWTPLPNSLTGATNNMFISDAEGALTPPGGAVNANIDVNSNSIPTPVLTNKLELQLGTNGDSYMLQNVAFSIPVADVTIEKTFNGTLDTQTINATESPTYTIRVSNSGSATLGSIVVTDPLAPNCARNPLTPASLAPGATTTYTCTGPPASANLTNTASVTAQSSTGPVTDSDTTQVVVLTPNMDLAKTPGAVSGPTADGTYTMTYTVTATNSGAGYGLFGALTDTPSFASNLQITGAAWSGATTGSATTAGPYTLLPASTRFNAGQTRTWTVTLTFRYTDAIQAVSCNGPGTGTYNAVSLPAGQETGETTNNSACQAPPPPPTRTLSLTKSASPLSYVAGTVVTYTFVVTNTGQSTMNNVSVVDTGMTGLSPSVAHRPLRRR